MRLHLVDGTFELFRAHFSKRPDHASPQGKPLKATVGVADSMMTLLAEAGERVTHLAVAFDNPIRSFRNDLFPAYKSDEGMDPELRSQFDDVEEAVRALGIVVWSMNEFEADDALATATARWRDEVEQVRILTPDKDLGQCLSGTKVIVVDRIRRTELDEAGLRAKRGIAPASIPDYLALVGDDADGIPGLPGFGERTASRLLDRFGNLEGIPRAPASWPSDIRGAAGLAETLAARMGDALLYRRLATLERAVPLKESLEDLRWGGVPPGFDAWCEKVGSQSLRERPRPRPN
jgi:5'-3' exonuclease